MRRICGCSPASQSAVQRLPTSAGGHWFRTRPRRADGGADLCDRLANRHHPLPADRRDPRCGSRSVRTLVRVTAGDARRPRARPDVRAGASSDGWPEPTLEAVAPLDVFVRPQRLLAAPPRHVLDQLLFPPRQRRLVARAALDVSERVGHKPVPREMRIGIQSSRAQGRASSSDPETAWPSSASRVR